MHACFLAMTVQLSLSTIVQYQLMHHQRMIQCLKGVAVSSSLLA